MATRSEVEVLAMLSPQWVIHPGEGERGGGGRQVFESSEALK